MGANKCVYEFIYVWGLMGYYYKHSKNNYYIKDEILILILRTIC